MIVPTGYDAPSGACVIDVSPSTTLNGSLVSDSIFVMDLTGTLVVLVVKGRL